LENRPRAQNRPDGPPRCSASGGDFCAPYGELANRCKYQRKRIAAFEISAKNRKNRENNKREQARPKKISHLAEASGFRPVRCTTRHAKSPAQFRPGLLQPFQIALSRTSRVTSQVKF
jgi:hypothetical protein